MSSNDEILVFKSTGEFSRAELTELSRTDHDRALTLIIAGIDSGGGAGLTADCISVHDAGGFPLVCPTALTVQSLKRVRTVQNVEPALFKETLDTLIEDFPKISSVKIGLVASQALLDIILDYLEGPLKDAYVVWDPVLTATAGDFESADLKGSLARILKVTDVFTPNLNEALALAGWSKERYKEEGAEALAAVFAVNGCAVLVKGGHIDDATTSTDTLKTASILATFSHERKAGDGAHGGGCALSSSIAANLAAGYSVQDAVTLAKTYVTYGIEVPDIKSEGARPPVGHHEDFLQPQYIPSVRESHFPIYDGEPFRACPDNLGFYVVLDSSDWIERCAKLGVKTLQLRIKDPKRPDLYDEVVRAVAIAKKYGVRLYINDYYDLAIKAGAYGVHMGMDDLKDKDMDIIKKAGLRLGVSTTGPYEIMKALSLKPSYVALGHIFPTNTKEMTSKPQGLWKLSREIALLNKLKMPYTTIGGINLENAKQLLAIGVKSVAVVSAVTKAPDVKVACDTWLELFGPGGEDTL